MSILIDENTLVLVQGITGREGQFHTQKMLEYSTKIVAGVTPGKGGSKVLGINVYNTVKQAVSETKANASVIFVPAFAAADAIIEAIEAGIKVIVCITEGVPVNDMLEVYWIAKQNDVCLIGPNCPGIISPEKCKIGIMPGHIHKKGNIGVISRSGTLTYEIVNNLTLSGLGQSTCIGIGGDPIVGSSFLDLLKKFKDDEQTQAVVLIGEIGGKEEELAADYIESEFKKKAVAFIAGRSAPKGKRMGHAGAIISGSEGGAENKIKYLNKKNIPVANDPAQIPELLKQIIK